MKPEYHTWLKEIGKPDELKESAARMATNLGRKRIKTEVVPNYRALIPITETNLVFNLNNEPAYKYNILNIGDKRYKI